MDPFVSRLFQIESGGNPTAATGSYRGLSQLDRGEEAQYGINDSNYTDPNLQTNAVLGIDARNTNALTSGLGYAPSPGERYVAWQQGPSGAMALANGGSTPAWQTIRQFYKTDAMAQKAISGNPFMKGMDPNISSASFYNGWKNKFESGYGGALSSANTPTTGGQHMPDQGALSLPPDPSGVLSSGGWAGSGGIGNTLQNVGAWLQSANNPSGAASMLQQANQPRQQQQQMAMQLRLGMKPQVVNGGTDPFTGANRLSVFDPITRTAKMYTVDGNGGVTPGSLSGDPSIDQFEKAVNQGVTGSDLMQYVPPAYQEGIKALQEGRAIPGNMGRGPARLAIMQMAHAIDPTMDETNIQARQTMAKSMASPAKNQLGGQIQSSDTLMQHLGHVWQDIDDLSALGVTGRFTGPNWLSQAATYYSGNEKVQAALANFSKHSQAAAGELVNLTRGTGGSLKEVEDWKAGMQPYAPEATLRAGVASAIDLMHGRVDSGIYHYNQVMGKNGEPETYLAPQSRATIDKIGNGVAKYAPGAPPVQSQAPANRPPLSSFYK